jgi:hypothetical protein
MDDGNTCTLDECDSEGMCLHPDAPNNMPCMDDDACTEDTVCVDGECADGTTVICDDDDVCTQGSCDPEAGCIYEVVVESPTCGSCEDGIDNDGNGLIDAEDPSCSTLHLFQRYAVIGTALLGQRSLRFNRNAEITHTLPLVAGTSGAFIPRAGACGVDLKSAVAVLVTGTQAVTRDAKFGAAGGLPTRIGFEFLNTGGVVKTGRREPLVGPPQACTEGAVLCNQNSDCPPGQLCDVALPLGHPANQYVNMTGTAPDMLLCEAILDFIPSLAALIDGLPQTMKLGNIRLREGNAPLQINLPSGQQVVDIDELRIGRTVKLILNGQPDTVVVLRVHGRFRIGLLSSVMLAGGLTADRVIWSIEGPGRGAKIGRGGSVPGTIIAAQRPRIHLGRFGLIEGALIGKHVKMGLGSIVDHVPFTALLTGSTGQAETFAIRRITMRYDTAGNKDNGNFRIRGIVDDTLTGGSLPASLLSNTVTVNVKDAAFYDATVTLTGCTSSGGGKRIRCKSSNRFLKASFRRIRDDPQLYKASIKARRLSNAQTSTAQPIGPVTVVLQQSAGPMQGSLDLCARRGNFALRCRRRT